MDCCSDACCELPDADSTPIASVEASVCPSCGAAGRRVDALTVKALLAVSLMRVADTDYRFCATPGCPVVYYAAGGQSVFTESDLRERVYQKHPDDESAPVCYCFRHSAGAIRAEAGQPQASGIVNAINRGIREGKCACEIRNPQGTCCLGNVRALVRTHATAGETPLLKLADLRGVEDLQARFDADEGTARLILLHSPT